MKQTQFNKISNLMVLTGDLDLFRSYELYQLVEASLNARESLCIDLSGVRKIDLSCIQILIAARRQCVHSGLEFLLVNPAKEILLFLQLCGLEKELTQFTPYDRVNLEPETRSIDPKRVSQEKWHLSIRFDKDVFKYGGDIVACFAQLKTSGSVIAILPCLSQLPGYFSVISDECYIGFEIACDSSANRALIENIFESVLEESDLIIVSPESSIREYSILLNQRSDDYKSIKIFWNKTNLLSGQQIEQVDQLFFEYKRNKLASVETEESLERRKLDDKKERYCIDSVGIEHSLNTLGEIMIACSTNQLLAAQWGEKKLVDNVKLINKLVTELQGSLNSLRTGHIRDLFNYLARSGMEYARELGAEASFNLVNSNFELDAATLNDLVELMFSLIQFQLQFSQELNKKQSSKEEIIRLEINLNARSESDYLVIEVQTAGYNLDLDKIKKAALYTKALDCGADIITSELKQLVLEAAENEWETDNRMPASRVQYTTIREQLMTIGGSLNFNHGLQDGDKFVLRIPFSTTVIDGLLIVVGENTYVIPKENILESVDSIAYGKDLEHGQRTLKMRGETLPLISLREVLNVQGEVVEEECIVVVECGRHKVALVGDYLDGEFQTATKPLGRILSQLKSISGATLLNSGKIAMVLDIVGLIQDMYSNEERILHSSRTVSSGKCVH